MNSNTIDYHNRQLDLSLLKKIAGQGCIINVNSNQLNAVASSDHPELVVVAAGSASGLGAYDVLAGKIKDGVQKARLVSKIVLKKAYVPPPQPEHNTPYRSNNEASSYGGDRFQQLQNHYSRDRRY